MFFPAGVVGSALISCGAFPRHRSGDAMWSNFRHSVLGGVGLFGFAYALDHLRGQLRFLPNGSLLDDLAIGLLAGGGIFLLLRHTDLSRELRRRDHFAKIIAQLNHHIRNALQVILARADLTMHDLPEMKEIAAAVSRIDWALREILPQVQRQPEGYSASSGVLGDERAPFQPPQQ
jgi:hypothetical protein